MKAILTEDRPDIAIEINLLGMDIQDEKGQNENQASLSSAS